AAATGLAAGSANGRAAGSAGAAETAKEHSPAAEWPPDLPSSLVKVARSARRVLAPLAVQNARAKRPCCACATPGMKPAGTRARSANSRATRRHNAASRRWRRLGMAAGMDEVWGRPERAVHLR